MCDPAQHFDSVQVSKPAANKLSDLIYSELGVCINPQALRMFIRANWDEIAKQAHKIHGQ